MSTEPSPNTGWDAEYRRGGVPSSLRDAPSSAVLWAADNWLRVTGTAAPRTGLDVGCGTARNTVYLAERGTRMIAFDRSPVAVERAQSRVADARVSARVRVHDLADGLPAGDGEIDLVLDVFVYKHQVQPADRQAYRRELRRVLAPGGRLLLSLAEPDDGYYGACPPLDDPRAGPRAVVDPAVGAGSVLFTLGELAAELGDTFRLDMAWRKEQRGPMHGAEYVRRTSVTLWSAGDDG